MLRKSRLVLGEDYGYFCAKDNSTLAILLGGIEPERGRGIIVNVAEPPGRRAGVKRKRAMAERAMARAGESGSSLACPVGPRSTVGAGPARPPVSGTGPGKDRNDAL